MLRIAAAVAVIGVIAVFVGIMYLRFSDDAEPLHNQSGIAGEKVTPANLQPVCGTTCQLGYNKPRAWLGPTPTSCRFNCVFGADAATPRQ